jgi:hypothetical protein
MSVRGLSAASEGSFSLSPDAYGFYRPARLQWWPLLACLGVGGVCLLNVLLIQQTDGPLARSVLSPNAGPVAASANAKVAVPREAPAAPLATAGHTGAVAIVARPEAAMPSVQTNATSSDASPEVPNAAPETPAARPPVVTPSQHAHRAAPSKAQNQYARGHGRKTGNSWGRYGYSANPNGGGWSIN